MLESIIIHSRKHHHSCQKALSFILENIIINSRKHNSFQKTLSFILENIIHSRKHHHSFQKTSSFVISVILCLQSCQKLMIPAKYTQESKKSNQPPPKTSKPLKPRPNTAYSSCQICLYLCCASTVAFEASIQPVLYQLISHIVKYWDHF